MMKKHPTRRSSMLLPSSLLIGAALLSGIFVLNNSNTRQYHSTAKEKEVERDNGAAGMAQFFFNARKNPLTNQMDYAAMAQSEQQIATMNAARSSERLTASGLGLNWIGLGPSNVGGRTRAILVDKLDPSGNTLFAGGVSGGIWKSTNGGATWDSINDNLSSLAVSCITQDANGVIYVGTGEGFSVYSMGEGFSTAILGGGIFKSKDDGATFYSVPSTVPKSNSIVTWAYVNRIAVSPCDPKVVYAETYGGLMVSNDSGTTWHYAYNSVSKAKLNSASAYGGDVKISTDGSVVIASVNGIAYITYPSCSSPFDTMFTKISTAKYGGMPTGNRIELAISPTNSNYMYASVAVNSGTPGKGLVGIYMSMDKGAYWYLVGPGGSLIFDPYEEGGSTPDQATYDNAMAVDPANPGRILIGGTTLWAWEQATTSDTVGSWKNISHYYRYYLGDPLYIHPDEHAIVFDLNHSNVVYDGCDGGIFKSGNSGSTWAPMNRNYNVTQFYSLSFSPYINTNNGEGILGGTQDNGTPYVDGLAYPYYEDQERDLSGGDGGGSAISYINSNIFFTSIDYGTSFGRGAGLTTGGYPGSFYTTTEGINKGANIDSIASLSTGCFAFPMALYENMYDNKTLDSILWIADANHNAGDTVYPISPNGNVPFPSILVKSVSQNDTVKVKNTVVAKMAIGFAASQGVWLCMQADDLADPAIWMPIGGPNSKPAAFTGGDAVHCLAWSSDGDALFVGTEGGQLFRFSNLDSIIDTSYTTGALWYVKQGTSGKTLMTSSRVISTNIGGATFSGRDILSISLDPYNSNNMLVTVGGYGSTTYVYSINNALAATGPYTFKSKQGTGATALPAMPVYSSILDVLGNNFGPKNNPNTALVGTEHGVYSTTNFNATNPTWQPENAGAANTLVLALKQQTLNPYFCNNSGNIYMGSHGRGAWYSGSIGPLAVQDVTATKSNSGLKVYPNPMSIEGTLDFTLSKEDNITIAIYDIQGREVKNQTQKLSAGEHLMPIYTQDMSNGTYIVTVTGSSFRKTARIVVAR